MRIGAAAWAVGDHKNRVRDARVEERLKTGPLYNV
jgi:hypothetical protein